MAFTRFSFLLFLVCFSCSSIVAQPYVDLFNVKAEYFPGHMDNGENTDSLSTVNYAARFLVPLQRKNEDVVLISGNFGLLRFDYAGFEPEQADLYTIRLAAGYNRLWKNKKWRTLVLALPKINSDMKKGTTDDFQMGGLAQHTWLKSDSL